MTSARRIANQILANVLAQDGSLSTQFTRVLKNAERDDQGFIKELCFGVCRYYPELNTIALSLLQKPFEEKDLDLYANLLMGLYQLEHMSTPDHAALHESVELCRELEKEWATKLTNAVLRRYLREKDDIKASVAKQPSAQFNLPKWLMKRFQKAWGNEIHELVTATNSRPPMCIRVNLSKVSRETYQAKLLEEGIVSHETPVSDSGLYLDTPIAVTLLPEFENGWCSVQDESAQLAAQILLPQADETLLDACAAPGGKTGHLLEQALGAQVTAVELESWRLARIEENLERLGVSAAIHCADAGDLDAWWDGAQFDKVLLDAPCSATGVIRRNPDIKINRKPADIDELVSIQATLLDQIWQTVKPGGYLLYATCSLMPEENDLQMDQFLGKTPNACVQPINQINSEMSIQFGLPQTHGVQILPQLDKQDGFYYCLIKKGK